MTYKKLLAAALLTVGDKICRENKAKVLKPNSISSSTQ
jgi:hypothetical protein